MTNNQQMKKTDELILEWELAESFLFEAKKRGNKEYEEKSKKMCIDAINKIQTHIL